MTGPAIPVLLYHAVCTDPSGWIAPFAVTPDTFRRHLDLVVASGRTAMTVSGLRTVLETGEPAPHRPVVVTFDDGFADTADFAAPLLTDLGLPATVFLTTGFVDGTSPGGDRMMSWSAASELAAAGHEIGGHSVRHPELDTLRSAAAREEISTCRHQLQDRLAGPVHSFAYPHGYSSPAVRRLVAAAGYRSACAVKNAFSHPADPAFAIARLMITRHTTEGTVAGWLAGRGAPLARRTDRLATHGWRTYRRIRSRT